MREARTREEEEENEDEAFVAPVGASFVAPVGASIDDDVRRRLWIFLRESILHDMVACLGKFSRDKTNACTDLVFISIDYNTICSHCRISMCEIVQIVYSSCMLHPVFCSNPRTRVQF